MLLVALLTDYPGFIVSLLIAIVGAWVVGIIAVGRVRSLRNGHRYSAILTCMQVIAVLAVAFSLPRIEQGAVWMFLIMLVPSVLITRAFDRR